LILNRFDSRQLKRIWSFFLSCAVVMFQSCAFCNTVRAEDGTTDEKSTDLDAAVAKDPLLQLLKVMEFETIYTSPFSDGSETITLKSERLGRARPFVNLHMTIREKNLDRLQLQFCDTDFYLTPNPFEKKREYCSIVRALVSGFMIAATMHFSKNGKDDENSLAIISKWSERKNNGTEGIFSEFNDLTEGETRRQIPVSGGIWTLTRYTSRTHTIIEFQFDPTPAISIGTLASGDGSVWGRFMFGRTPDTSALSDVDDASLLKSLEPLNDLNSGLNAGLGATISLLNQDARAHGLRAGHAYSVVGYRPETKSLLIVDPNDEVKPSDIPGVLCDDTMPGCFWMPISVFRKYFDSIERYP